MNDREIITSIRDMQGSDGKEGHWYILGEPQRAALTRYLDATDPDKAEGHAKVLLEESQRQDDYSADGVDLPELFYALRAGALAITEVAALKKRNAALEAAQCSCGGAHYCESEYKALEAELAIFRNRASLSGDVMYWIAEHDVAQAKYESFRIALEQVRAELAELQDHCAKWVEEANKRGNERDTAVAELAAAKADYQREHDYITVVVSERDNLRAEVDALREKLAGAKHV